MFLKNGSLSYKGIQEKGSGDVFSAVCYTIYTIYLSLCTHTAETTTPEPFFVKSHVPVYSRIDIVFIKRVYTEETIFMKPAVPASYDIKCSLFMNTLLKKGVNL